ncbi:MAG: hypothetical protein QM658_03650 [Gordonia sp. (in: high G+C Gram-positive bacteria)]
MSATAAPSLPIKTIANHVVVPALIGVVMVLCYLGGFHKPDPHELAVQVVGQPAVTAPIAAGLHQKAGDHLSITTTESIDEARDAIRNRTSSAAFVPGHDGAQLLVSTAAGDPTAVIAERLFGTAAVTIHQPLTIVDVVPADPNDDPSGQGMFFFLVSLTVGSYASGIAIAVAAAGRSMRFRVAFAGASAVIVASVISAIAFLGFHALPSGQWSIFGLSVVYSLAIMLAAVGLHPLIGRFTTAAMVTLFVGLNFTSSGGVFSPELQPRFFGLLHDFWIGAGLNEAGRDLSYFPWLSITGEVWKIVGWLIAAGVLVAVAAYVERRRAITAAAAHRPEPVETPAELKAELEEEVVIA